MMVLNVDAGHSDGNADGDSDDGDDEDDGRTVKGSPPASSRLPQAPPSTTHSLPGQAARYDFIHLHISAFSLNT